MKSYTLFRTERPKTIPCPAAHPRTGHIREYPPGPCVQYANHHNIATPLAYCRPSDSKDVSSQPPRFSRSFSQLTLSPSLCPQSRSWNRLAPLRLCRAWQVRAYKIKVNHEPVNFCALSFAFNKQTKTSKYGFL